jgi:hypothetical protein
MLLFATLISLAALSKTAIIEPEDPAGIAIHPGPTEPQELDRDWLLSRNTELYYTDSWQPNSRDDYTYNQAGQVVHLNTSIWSGGDWTQTWIRDHYYGSDGLIQEIMIWVYSYGEWSKYQKVEYIHDNAGRLAQKTIFTFFNNAWVETTHLVCTYNNAGLISNETTHYNNGSTDIIGYTYNADLQLTQVYSQYIIGDWEGYYEYKALYTYNPDGRLAMLLYQEPQGGNYEWQDVTRQLYTYDTNGLVIEELSQNYYSGSTWENNYHYLYTYDADSRLTGKLCQEYDDGWLNYYLYTYTNDANGNDVEIIYQEWSGSAWLDDRKWVREFISSDAGDELTPAPVARLICRPNPFNGTTEVVFFLKHPGSVTLEVFNVRGQKVAVLPQGILYPGAQCLAWDGRDESGSSLPKGVYLIQARTDGVIAAQGKVTIR